MPTDCDLYVLFVINIVNRDHRLDMVATVLARYIQEMDDIGEIFKVNLRNYRSQKNWTREKLAEYAGVSPVSVQRWEDGDRWPRPPQIKKLADALNILPAKLFADPEVSEITPRQALEVLKKALDAGNNH